MARKYRPMLSEDAEAALSRLIGMTSRVLPAGRYLSRMLPKLAALADSLGDAKSVDAKVLADVLLLADTE